MEKINFVLGFLIVYLLGGRKCAIPYGVLMLKNLYLIILLTLFLDIIQIPIFFLIWEKIKIFRKISIWEKFKEKNERLKRSTLIKTGRRLKYLGVIIVASLPSFGGGVWSATLLCKILKVKIWLAYILILLGSLFGISILVFGSQAIIQTLISILHLR